MPTNRAHRIVSTAWSIAGLALILAYPPITHYATIAGKPTLALLILACLVVYILISVLPATPVKWLLPVLLFAIPTLHDLKFDWLLYLPPTLINLALCWVFGRTLIQGRRPFISRLAEMEHGTLTLELATYTRRLTWIWTVFFLTMALISATLAIFGSLSAWSMFTSVINYLLVAALFAGEYIYRHVRYPHYQHDSPLQLIRRIRMTGRLHRESSQ